MIKVYIEHKIAINCCHVFAHYHSGQCAMRSRGKYKGYIFVIWENEYFEKT